MANAFTLATSVQTFVIVHNDLEREADSFHLTTIRDV
jgi:hypothetical protein